MTETLVGVSPPKENKKAVSPDEQEHAAARELVKAARARGFALTGPDGLLKAITKTVLESALEEEMSEHVGYDKHAVQGRNGGNSRNGTRSKTVLTAAAGGSRCRCRGTGRARSIRSWSGSGSAGCRMSTRWRSRSMRRA